MQENDRFIFSLDQDTDLRLLIHCIFMGITNFIWLLNLFFAAVCFRNGHMTPQAFDSFVFLLYGLFFVALGLYSLKMLITNFKCLYRYIFKVQHYAVIQTFKEKYNDTLPLLKEEIGNDKYYFFCLLAAILVLFFTASYFADAKWTEAMFSTFCVAALFSDRLMGVEKYKFDAFMKAGRDYYLSSHRQPFSH